ncbi:MAG: polysaccharide deacetylase family protein [Chloroflexota bacterium]|nr:polysaccharide deacetylase family protein [Chloroflexota bacterium]
MRKQVGVMVAACFYYSGLVKLARWWRHRSGQHLVILNYHRATGGDLRRHLLYLRHHYRMLHLDEALEELYMPSQQKVIRDQRTPLVLTFDDGYSDNYLHAFVLACELQAPISIFLIPGYAESSDYFWWQEGKRLVRRAEVTEVTFEGQTYHLNQSGQRDILTQAIDARLRYATSVAEREAFLGTMRKALAVPSSITVEEEATLPLTWAEIGKMAESGWVSFGAHTMHHPVLAHLADPAEVRSEVGECRKVLEQQLGHPVRTFAYPIGKLKDIGEEGLRAVQEAGYDWAVTTMNGTNTPQSDPYQLRRVSGDVSRHWLVMAAEVSGLWHFFFGLRKKL